VTMSTMLDPAGRSSAARRTIAMIAVTTVLVTGCSTGQGDPKVAATVGTTSVSTVEQVQQRLNDLLAHNPQAQDVAKQHKLDQVTRGIVSQDVLHVLAAEAAKRQNIAVDESLLPQLTPVFTGAQATGGDPFQALVDSSFNATDLTRDRLIMAELGRRAVGKTIVTIDGAILSDGAKARELAKQIAANPGQSSQLVQNAPSQLQEPFVDQPFGAAPADAQGGADAVSTVVGQNALAFMGAPEKSVVLWRLTGQQGGYAVIYVKKRSSAPPSAQLDLSQVQPAQLVAVGEVQLMASAWQQGVTPNQRYGAWDPVALKVIPTEEAAVGSMVFTPNTKQP
jgi:hypothetical protein